jgi:hypothetical protein
VSRQSKNWTGQEATEAIPLVRRCLAKLREQYVLMMHLHCKEKKALTAEEQDDLRIRVEKAMNAAIAALNEVLNLGIVVYDKAWRGIALFPFQVRHQEQQSVVRDALFVFKDSRATIDSFVLAERLAETNDLFGEERPIPDEWKKEGCGLPCLHTHRS